MKQSVVKFEKYHNAKKRGNIKAKALASYIEKHTKSVDTSNLDLLSLQNDIEKIYYESELYRSKNNNLDN